MSSGRSGKVIFADRRDGGDVTSGSALDYLKEELAALDEQGLRLHPRTLEGEQRARTRFDGRDVINLASNNYLGLAAHPRLKEAASKAAAGVRRRLGRGRTIAGTMSLHRELERRFAEFKDAERALMFQSGFTANAGTVAAILSKEDVIVSDQLNHASIIDGARLSRAEIKVFPHKDVEAADALLAETARPGRHQLLITDGVFSMDGDIAPLPGLVEVAEQHGAIMMIDDAHASGVLGHGRQRHRRALRPARPGGHPGRHALEGDRRPGRLHRRPDAPDRVAAEPGPAVPVLHVARRRRSPRHASPRSTSCATSRNASSGSGRTHALFKKGCIRSASTPETPRHPSRRSSRATRRRRRCSPAGCSRRASSARRSCSRPSDADGRASGRS